MLIQWADQNNGAGDAGGGWVDLVVVVNTTTSETLHTAVLAYDPAVDGVIPAGGSRSRRYAFRLPTVSAAPSIGISGHDRLLQ